MMIRRRQCCQHSRTGAGLRGMSGLLTRSSSIHKSPHYTAWVSQHQFAIGHGRHKYLTSSVLYLSALSHSKLQLAEYKPNKLTLNQTQPHKPHLQPSSWDPAPPASAAAVLLAQGAALARAAAYVCLSLFLFLALRFAVWLTRVQH